MAIEFKRCFVVGDKTFTELWQAKAEELLQIMNIPDSLTKVEQACVADRLLASSDRVVDILTTTEKSLPKARAVNGGKKPRKSKEPAPEPQLPKDNT